MGNPDGKTSGGSGSSESRTSTLRAAFDLDGDAAPEAWFSATRIPPRLAAAVFLALVLFVLYLFARGVLSL